MDIKCPGSKSVREPIPEIHICPDCGEEVEIWTNELKRKCSSCGKAIVREIDTAYCIQWCHYAKECIGVEKYEELLESGALSKDNMDGARIPERLKELLKEGGVPIPGEDT